MTARSGACLFSFAVYGALPADVSPSGENTDAYTGVVAA